jgi:hypothetical protein
MRKLVGPIALPMIAGATAVFVSVGFVHALREVQSPVVITCAMLVFFVISATVLSTLQHSNSE